MLTSDHVKKISENKKQIIVRFLDRVAKKASNHKNIVLVALTMVFISFASWGYSGSNTKLLGPPIGKFPLAQDFRAILRAAKEIRSDNNPYLHAVEFGSNPNFYEFMGWNVAPYVYPPLAAILARPFLILEPELAVKIWTGINILLLAASSLLIVNLFSQANFEKIVAFIFLFALFLTFGPIQIDLMLGQVDILIVFLLILIYYLYRIKKRPFSGVTLAIAISIKPILAPMLLFFIWKRQWMTVIITITTTFLLTIIGFVLIGWSQLPTYLEVNRLWSSGKMLAFPVNQSPNGLILRMFTENGYIHPLVELNWFANLLPVFTSVLFFSLWLIAVTFNKRKRTATDSFATDSLEYGLTLTTLMLISPFIGQNHFVWLLVPIAFFFLTAVDGLSEVQNLLLLVIGLPIVFYLAYPDLHDAIYSGSELLRHQNTKVATSYSFFTGAYLYGLLAFNFLILIHISWLKGLFPVRSMICQKFRAVTTL